jgi:hypothetical protein
MKFFKLTLHIITSALLLSGCSENNSKPELQTKDATTIQEEGHTNKNDDSGYITEKIDSNERIKFWNYAVVPILKREREEVMSTIDFPLAGSWAKMMGLEKESTQATKEEFIEKYDKLFNTEFIQMLSFKSYKDLSVYKDDGDTSYSFSLLKSDEGYEAGVGLVYRKRDGVYKLKAFEGAGGDFYYHE